MSTRIASAQIQIGPIEIRQDLQIDHERHVTVAQKTTSILIPGGDYSVVEATAILVCLQAAIEEVSHRDFGKVDPNFDDEQVQP